MKKSLVALAALAVVGVASAQSTVTLFGGADVNVRSVTNGDNKFSGMGQDGIYSSRIGVNGTEDLTGGNKALFHFEGGMAPDTGTSAGFNFKRKSVIGLSGGFGEVRFGRDYTPVFTQHGADPFGTNGLGSAFNLMGSTNTYAATTAGTFQTAVAASAATVAAATNAAQTTFADPAAVRSDNSIAYYSPAFNGISTAVMMGYGLENTNVARGQGKVTSVKVAYDNGPLSFSVGNQLTKGGPSSVATGDSEKWDTTVVGATYDLGVAKLAFLNRGETYKQASSETKYANRLFGVSAPFGALTLKASIVSKKVGSAKAGTQNAIGGVYDLSKRTSVYGTYSTLKNEIGYANTVNGGVASAASTAANKSSGYEFGLKHAF